MIALPRVEVVRPPDNHPIFYPKLRPLGCAIFRGGAAWLLCIVNIQEHRPMLRSDAFHELNDTKKRSQRLIDDAVQIRLDGQEMRSSLAAAVRRLIEARARRAPD